MWYQLGAYAFDKKHSDEKVFFMTETTLVVRRRCWPAKLARTMEGGYQVVIVAQPTGPFIGFGIFATCLHPGLAAPRRFIARPGAFRAFVRRGRQNPTTFVRDPDAGSRQAPANDVPHDHASFCVAFRLRLPNLRI